MTVADFTAYLKSSYAEFGLRQKGRKSAHPESRSLMRERERERERERKRERERGKKGGNADRETPILKPGEGRLREDCAMASGLNGTPRVETAWNQ